MAYASLERFRDITGAMCWRCNKPKEAGKKGRGPVLHLFAAGNRPCRRSHSGFAVRHEKRFHRWRKPCSPPRCPLIQSSFGFALQDSCPYLAASDIVVADTLRRQEKDVRTAGRLQAGRTAPASADSGQGRQGLLARPVRQARREAGKGFRRFPSPRTICGMPSG